MPDSDVGVGEAAEDLDRGDDGLPFVLGQAFERFHQPALTDGAVSLDPLFARRGEADEGAAPVIGVGAAPDQVVGFEVADRLRHRLRPHPLGGGEVGDALVAAAVEPSQHRRLVQREDRALGAQPADQLPDHRPQVGGEEGEIDVRLRGHPPMLAEIGR